MSKISDFYKHLKDIGIDMLDNSSGQVFVNDRDDEWLGPKGVYIRPFPKDKLKLWKGGGKLTKDRGTGNSVIVIDDRELGKELNQVYEKIQEHQEAIWKVENDEYEATTKIVTSVLRAIKEQVDKTIREEFAPKAKEAQDTMDNSIKQIRKQLEIEK